MPFDVVSYILARRRALSWNEFKNRLSSDDTVIVVAYDTDKDGLIDKIDP